MNIENSCVLIASIYMKVSLNTEKHNGLRKTTNVLCAMHPQSSLHTIASIIFPNLKFDLHKTSQRHQSS